VRNESLRGIQLLDITRVIVHGLYAWLWVLDERLGTVSADRSRGQPEKRE